MAGLVGRLIRVLLIAAVALGTVFLAVIGAAPASAVVAVSTCDAAVYVYDGPVQLSTPHTLVGTPRGSPVPGAASWGRSVAVGGFGVAANTAERTVAMGRNMTDRVIPYATKNGYGWYHGTPGWVPRSAIERISPRALERTDLWFNQSWIRGEMRGGSRIVDIGEPPGYQPSAFYDMERQQVSRYWNYVQDIQP